MTEDQGRDLLAGWRDKAFADLITVVLGLAAQQNPTELRKALGAVFDVSRFEDNLKRLHLLMADVQNDAREYRELLHQINLDLERIEQRQDAIEERQERDTARTGRKGSTDASPAKTVLPQKPEGQHR